jgi:hypothetical protein
MLTPLIMEGVDSIFQEAYNVCKKSKQKEKYLMTFQNLLVRVPKWNETIIEKECQRIVTKSNCNYMEDIITCVHIIQLKCMTAMRVGTKQKKIDIDVPKLNSFIHKCYINVARSVYNNVYLYEIKNKSLDKQKNRRLCELIIQECILNTIRSNIPIQEIIRSYLDETTEMDVIEKIEEEVVQEKIDLNTLQKQLDEVKVEEPKEVKESFIPSPTLEKYPEPEDVIKPESSYSEEVKNIITNMKEENIISSLYDNTNVPVIENDNFRTPNESNDGDSDTDSIIFEKDDDLISLSNFDIQDL